MHPLDPYDANDPSCERTDLGFCIYSDSITPSAITHLLGIKPTRSTTIGETIVNARTGYSRTGTINAWILLSEDYVSSKDTRDHLDWLMDIIGPARAGIAELQKNPSVQMRVCCVWWAGLGGGPTLWPKQMRDLADLDLELSFSFSDYNDYEKEESQAST